MRNQLRTRGEENQRNKRLASSASWSRTRKWRFFIFTGSLSSSSSSSSSFHFLISFLLSFKLRQKTWEIGIQTSSPWRRFLEMRIFKNKKKTALEIIKGISSILFFSMTYVSRIGRDNETLVTVDDGRWRHQEMNTGCTGSESDQRHPRRISAEFLNVFLNPMQSFAVK